MDILAARLAPQLVMIQVLMFELEWNVSSAIYLTAWTRASALGPEALAKKIPGFITSTTLSIPLALRGTGGSVASYSRDMQDAVTLVSGRGTESDSVLSRRPVGGEHVTLRLTGASGVSPTLAGGTGWWRWGWCPAGGKHITRKVGERVGCSVQKCSIVSFGESPPPLG
eukprot:scaffold4080_cov129-Isochrysis_galbana.AAC.1